MKKGNGFTLIELLAVIAIIAIILVISIPKILDVIEESKINTLKNTVKLIADSAEKKYIENESFDEDEKITCKGVYKLNNNYKNCEIRFDLEGKATVVLNTKENSKFGLLGCKGTTDNVSCRNRELVIEKICTSNSELEVGDTYVDGQYTYTMKNKNGFSVVLTDKESTDEVITDLCSSINGKPIISMRDMFNDSKAELIDLISFDTSNVVDMARMFAGTLSETLDLSNFNTSKVTDMSGMFGACLTKTLDLSNFDTSNVTHMNFMFWGNKSKIIDLSSFNTSNVTHMNNMFGSVDAETLDLSNFDTSNVVSMAQMFIYSNVKNANFSSFNTSKVTDMSGMFSYCSLKKLDLSSFDMNNVVDTSDMFRGSSATIGYARTSLDADKLNASGNKATHLTFEVK